MTKRQKLEALRKQKLDAIVKKVGPCSACRSYKYCKSMKLLCFNDDCNSYTSFDIVNDSELDKVYKEVMGDD